MKYPFECTLIDENRETVQQNKGSFFTDDIIIYYSLYGLSGSFMIFAEDDTRNQQLEVDEDEKQPVHLTVFDLKDFYERHSFKDGDTLIFTVKDWFEGIYTIEYSPSDHMRENFVKVRDWCRTLDETFSEIFKDFGPFISIEEQLAYVLYYAPPTLLEFPGMHIGGYLNSSKTVELQPFGLNSIIWYRDEVPNIFAEAASELENYEPTGASDSLDAIFQDLGVDMNEDLLIAYMRDELYKGGKSLKSVQQRCFSDRVFHFYDENQEQSYTKKTTNLWKKVQKNYNRIVDQRVAKTRNGLLEVNDHIVEWLRSLDKRRVNPEELPAERMMELSQITQGVTMMLMSLNEPENIEPDFLKSVNILLYKDAVASFIEFVESELN